MKLVIDLDDVVQLGSDGSQFVFKPDAEESIHKLLTYQKQVEEALASVKAAIASQGEALSSNFTGVSGSQVRASFAARGGSKYEVESTIADTSFYESVTTISPKTKVIEDHVKRHGALPVGIVERERKKSVSLTLLKDK